MRTSTLRRPLSVAVLSLAVLASAAVAATPAKAWSQQCGTTTTAIGFSASPSVSGPPPIAVTVNLPNYTLALTGGTQPWPGGAIGGYLDWGDGSAHYDLGFVECTYTDPQGTLQRELVIPAGVFAHTYGGGLGGIPITLVRWDEWTGTRHESYVSAGGVYLTAPPAVTKPAPPTQVAAAPRPQAADVTWSAPTDLGSGGLTGYTATATPGGRSCSTTGPTACTVTGLTDGTPYQVSVVTHSSAGDSAPSPAASVTPGAAPAFASPALLAATPGRRFSFIVTATGSPTPKISATGPLPPRVTLTDNGDGTATLAGTLLRAAAATYPVPLTATNALGSSTQQLTIAANRRPAITPVPAVTATVGSPLTLTITATGYPTPAIDVADPLPAGLTLTDHHDGTATISGTPTAPTRGRRGITVTLTATNPLGTAHQPLTLRITRAPAPTAAR